jgi:CO dehydrogenase/acetyl-CoA synthase beta subunit
LAFWIEEVKGIGIMSRGSEAIAPSGANWEQLANRAGGKQSPGIMGVSVYYIRSARFLQGDGGIHNVVWLDSGLYKRISDKLLPGQRVATEKDVQTVEQLKDFLEPLVST